MTATLPSRLSERTFRIYESDINFIVESFPKCVRLTPDESKSLNTYTARLRDAILSYSRFNWSPTTIRRGDFLLCVEQIYIKPMTDHVLAGGREAVIEAASIATGIKSAQAEQFDPMKLEPFFYEEGLSVDEIRFICILIERNIITRPFKTDGIDEQTATNLEENHDIVITREADGWFIIQ